MKVRKAVVVAAGLGTRMLPASKVIPKEILPVVDTPAIQIIFEEAIASGIEEIIVVITPGRTMVLDHFKTAAELERQLESKGKHEILKMPRKGLIDFPQQFALAVLHPQQEDSIRFERGAVGRVGEGFLARSVHRSDCAVGLLEDVAFALFKELTENL